VRRPRSAGLSRVERDRTDWVEIVAAVLLALATVATAWSGYQASRWNGEQTKAFSRANAARVNSTKSAGLAAELFFAGMSARLRTRGLREALLAFGVLVFVGTVAWAATFPVSISV